MFRCRHLPFVLLLVGLPVTAPLAWAAGQGTPSPDRRFVADTMAERVQACTVCHGEEGRASAVGYFPRIAGKPEGYLYNQLVNFKVGRRSNAAMHHLLEYLSDGFLREIAKHFADLDLSYPPPGPGVQSSREAHIAERLVLQGDAQRNLPACVHCHGQQLAGMQPAMPGLLGLSRDYLLSQFGAWRNGARRAKAPDCMADVAMRLGAEELSAVATWLSARILPAGTKPAQAAVAPLPMACGSVEP